ncbi:unnamed protein product, partial [Pocillopora meandrina]
DLGVLFEELRQFSDQRKFELINNVWRPGSTFLFPKTKESDRNKRFNSSWLQDFPWLVYSRYLDGAFCLPCVLFARQCGCNSAKLDKLVKSPLTFWTTAFNRLSNHGNGKCSTHNLSVIAMNNFVRVMKQEVVPVDQQLNTILQQQIAKNRTIMASLFKTVLFCGRNNIAFRGSRDEDPSNESLKGNFQALLYFRVESGDTVLQEHFETASRNAKDYNKAIYFHCMNHRLNLCIADTCSYQLLQRKEIDLLKAKDEIALLKHALADMQRNIDVRHHQLYVEAVELAASIGVQPSMPRVAVRQVHRANAPAADPEVYYRINLTRVFLDHCTQHIDRRFQNEVYSCYKGLYLVPKVMLSNAAVWKARVREFCNDYRQDIPNIAGLDGEFALWERMWRDQQNVRADPIPDRVSDTLAELDKHAFCNIYTILQLLATLPMS